MRLHHLKPHPRLFTTWALVAWASSNCIDFNFPPEKAPESNPALCQLTTKSEGSCDLASGLYCPANLASLNVTASPDTLLLCRSATSSLNVERHCPFGCNARSGNDHDGCKNGRPSEVVRTLLERSALRFMYGPASVAHALYGAEAPEAANPRRAHDLIGLSLEAKNWPEWGGESLRGKWPDHLVNMASAHDAIPILSYAVMSAAVRAAGESALTEFSSDYWSNVKLFLDRLASFCKPVIVNIEPGLWDEPFLQEKGDPREIRVSALEYASCEWLEQKPTPNFHSWNMAGFGRCWLHLARTRAPRVVVAYQASFGARTDADFWKALGAADADLMIAGAFRFDQECSALGLAHCTEMNHETFSWNENSFKDRLQWAESISVNLEDKPMLFSVPLRSPSGSPESTIAKHVQSFIDHEADLASKRVMGVLFVDHATQSITQTETLFESIKARLPSPATALP